jgi:hypothetical protein
MLARLGERAPMKLTSLSAELNLSESAICTTSSLSTLMRENFLQSRAHESVATAQAGICGTPLRGRNMVQLGIVLQYRARIDACIITEHFARHRLRLAAGARGRNTTVPKAMRFIRPCPR